MARLTPVWGTHSIGTNTATTKRALQSIYEAQTKRFVDRGHSLDLDWRDFMVEQGLTGRSVLVCKHRFGKFLVVHSTVVTVSALQWMVPLLAVT